MGPNPSPYSPPQFPMGQGDPSPSPESAGPARRAAKLLFVIAGLGILLGCCVGVSMTAFNEDQLKTFIADQHLASGISQLPPGWTIEQTVRVVFLMLAGAMVLVGIVLLVLGIFVGRASKGATVLSAIVCGLLATLMGFKVLFGLFVAATGNAMGLGESFASMIPLALLSLATVWLIHAWKELPGIEAARRQWQAYYTASQQQQQAFGHPQGQTPGYGKPTGAPPIGYGATPPVAPGEPSGPAVRHPPLPPDQQNPPQ